MPTLGAGIFVPQAKFAFPRSYIAGFAFTFDLGSSVTWTDNQADFTGPGGVIGRVTLEPRFYTWSSNRYTLDFLVIESWYALPPFYVETPLPFVLQPFTFVGTNTPYIIYSPFGIIGTGEFKHLLPPAPPDYWLPVWW